MKTDKIKIEISTKHLMPEINSMLCDLIDEFIRVLSFKHLTSERMIDELEEMKKKIKAGEAKG